MSKILTCFIQDRSGSMASVWTETLSGFKKFVKDLQDGEQTDEYLFSLTTFDTQIDTPIVAKPIKDVDVDILNKYGPRGSTALYDAVGITIDAIDKNRHGADKIIVVVVTDGQENSSREWSKDALHKAIEAKLNAGDWTFTYLGTQPETWDDATGIGVGVGSTSSYVGQAASQAYTVTACAVNNLAKSAISGSRSMLNDFSTRAMRTSASMKTKLDDLQDKINQTPLVPPGRPRTPAVPPKKKDTRRWK